MANNNPINVNVNSGHKGSPGIMAALSDALSNLGVGNPDIGQLRLAQVTNVDLSAGQVTLFVISDKSANITVPYPGFMTTTDGESGIWFGLNRGDLVICGIGYGNKYYILNKIGTGNSLTQSREINDEAIIYSLQGSSPNLSSIGLENGSFLLKSGSSKINISPKNGIFTGNLGFGSINFDISSSKAKRDNYTSLVSNQLINITNGGFNINGIVLRDKIPDVTGDSHKYSDPRTQNVWYDNLKQIPFDISSIISDQTSGNTKRNPAVIENRQLVYEFSDDMFIESDSKEALKLIEGTNGGPTQINDMLTSRRIRKEDCLSLSLVYPNALIEKIEGTVVDIRGNVLDLNRSVLPVGYDSLDTNLKTGSGYTHLRELYRKSIAFHWELNARKDRLNMNVETGKGNDYAKTTDTYKKDRSRLFLDIDKEGQFKLNIPASSEVGNISVLTRSENYTTINPYKKDDKADPNYDYYVNKVEANVDILLEQIGLCPVELKGNSNCLSKDRITNATLKLGTMFHDISKTCVYPIDDIAQNRSGILIAPDTSVSDLNLTKRYILRNTSENSVISKEIRIDRSGDTPNAGGRSGTAVFDGMLNLSIGANTADKQSLWLDLQGGYVQRIGADKNGISCITQTDGDFYLQVGGDPGYRGTDGSMSNIDPDPRFDNTKHENKNIVTLNSNKTNVFEIRIIQGNGQYSRILIDNFGILISSPKNIELRSDESIILSANTDVRINGESIKHHVDDFKNDLAVPGHRLSRKFEDVYEEDAAGGIIFHKPYTGSKQEY